MSRRPTVQKPHVDFGSESLGQRLARLRKQTGYTQIEFAKKIGITQALISGYETDRNQFSAEMAVRFAIALDISTDELLHPKATRKKITKKPSLKVIRRMEQIEKLPPLQQSTLLRTIDGFLKGAGIAG